MSRLQLKAIIEIQFKNLCYSRRADFDLRWDVAIEFKVLDLQEGAGGHFWVGCVNKLHSKWADGRDTHSSHVDRETGHTALTQGYLPYPDRSPALSLASQTHLPPLLLWGSASSSKELALSCPPSSLHSCFKSFSLPDAGYSEALEFHQCRSQQRLQGRWRCLK